MNRECQICGEDHDEEFHGEPIVCLQPSLHTVDEFNVEAIEEMQALEPGNKALQALYAEYEALYDIKIDNDARSEATQEICDDMMRALTLPYYFGDDTFAIYQR
jgi:L-arabinose isomerase